MAVAHVQSTASGAGVGATSIVLAFASNVTAGNLIAVGISWDSAAAEGISGVTDTPGNTYAEITNCRQRDATNTQNITTFYAKNISGGACAVTATFLGSRTARRITISEYSGCDTTAPLDQSTGQVQASPGTGADGITSTAVTTTANGELIYGLTMDDVGANTVTAGTGFTLRAQAGASPISCEDQVQTSAGSIASTFTQTTNHIALTSIATFKAAAVAATETSMLTLLGVGT